MTTAPDLSTPSRRKAVPAGEFPTRKQALALGYARYFTGKPCKNGHVTYRRICDSNCGQCAADRDAERLATPAGRASSRAATRKWVRKKMGCPEPGRPAPPFCECCGKPPGKNNTTLDLDHNHKTGKFRGWLCNACNTAIGKLGDTREGVLRAVLYLEKNDE